MSPNTLGEEVVEPLGEDRSLQEPPIFAPFEFKDAKPGETSIDRFAQPYPHLKGVSFNCFRKTTASHHAVLRIRRKIRGVGDRQLLELAEKLNEESHALNVCTILHRLAKGREMALRWMLGILQVQCTIIH